MNLTIRGDQLLKGAVVWENAKKERCRLIRKLADDADLHNEYCLIPDVYFENLDMKDYSITLQGLKKIAVLFSMDQFPREMEDRKGGRD